MLKVGSSEKVIFIVNFLRQRILLVVALVVMPCIVYGMTFFICKQVEKKTGDLDGRSATYFPVHDGDSAGYARLGENIVRHHVFSTSAKAPFVPNSFRTPGYPLVIALSLWVTGSAVPVVVLQTFLAIGTGLLVYVIGGRCYGKRIGFAAALCAIFSPTMVFYSLVLLSDVLSTFLLVAAVYLFFYASAQRIVRNTLIGSLLLGFAVLVRPINQFLPLLLAPFFFLMAGAGKARIVTAGKKAILVFVVVILMIVPWSLRNYQVFKTYSLSSTGAVGLFSYNVPEYIAFKRGASVGDVNKEMQAKVGLTESQLVDIRHAPELQRVALSYIRDDMFGYTVFHITKTIPFFLTSSVRNVVYAVEPLRQWWAVSFGAPERLPNFSSLLLAGKFGDLGVALKSQWLFTLEHLLWFLALFLGVLGLGLGSKETRKHTLLFLAIIVYYAVLTGPVANARYRLPIEPYIFLVAGGGFAAILAKIKLLKATLLRR